MGSWIVHVRDDVPVDKVVSRLSMHGVRLVETGEKITDRHLECIAPVKEIVVQPAIDKILGLSTQNIRAINECSTAFDVYPTDDKIRLSEADYRVGKALNLSDPALLRAVPVGNRYEVRFVESDSIVEKQRDALWKLGIELGPNPSWVTAPIFTAKSQQGPKASDRAGEHI